MQKKQLGQTDLYLSQIGLGTVKFGRNTQVKYPDKFELPSDAQIQYLLETARVLGINTLDTAPAYGSSETRLGRLLTNRQDWIIVGKTGERYENNQSSFDFSRVFTEHTIKNSLRKLKTDYLDIVLVHSSGDDLEIINNTPVLETLFSLKQKGLIRAVGMSTKTLEGGLKAAALTDVVMITHNLSYQAEKPVIDYAYKHNKGILIKKGLLSGHIDKIKQADPNQDPIQASMDFIFSTPGVTSLIIGTLNAKHLAENVGKFSGATTASTVSS